MAEVFAGHALGSHGFQKPVAIKRLLPELANDHLFVARLIGEAKLLVGMQHGNLVSVLDLARDGDDVFLVMEYVDGPSLRQLLRAQSHRALPLGIATYVVASAAAGLEFGHARPGGAVIHADISPSNVLLSTSGEVRVADFGIARREGGVMTTVEGKWAYMAPEQARGEPLTPSSDVFALGVVLYELITGVHPIGHTVTPDARELLQVRVVPPRVVQPAVPPGLNAIVMRALANDPCERYARMQQLIDALTDERFANGWREGANDLAQLIRDSGEGGITEPMTKITESGVTILTRSLISQSRSRPSAAGSTALTQPVPQEVLESAAAALAVRVPATEPPRRTSSIHAAIHVVRDHKWAIGVLAIAAVVGVVAGIAIQIAPEASAQATPPPPAPPPRHEPIVTPLPEPPAVEVAPPQEVAPAATAAPKPAAHKARAASAPAKEAVLRVNTMNGTWAYVHVGSEHGEAPGARFKLASGSYVVRLKNDIDPPRACSVTLAAGQTTTLTVEMEEGTCELR